MDEAKLLSFANELGREIRVFTNTATSCSSDEISAPPNDEPDDFYDFTPEDYYHIIGDKLGAQSQILKTRKMREAEAAARKARVTKAVIRFRFPDNYILEAKFQPSEKIQELVDLLKKVLARPDLPFYLYTTPPKEQIKDFSKDFYSAGFAPGAIIYFSYDLPKGPYLREDVLSLNGLDFAREVINPIHSDREIPIVEASRDVSEPAQSAKKKQSKPKWLKL
ncbi:plant UBX domain-containing protein 1 isoform X2 [Dendrobium catenatum]|uniref:plant UBX domain-containing protein 1 isoform X2 n=1 Tax=Dendrobium catenatum TaxID=906689 RepID=UPI0010A00C34|nr:plant UBX domain-containing protein 1 isoform X2 [Dendrobium catenatum]